MNSHRSFIFYVFSIAGIFIGVSLFSLHVQPVYAQDPVPTPIYDPLAQPELPPNPTDLEMGRYLFWRHCMPCHGDVGQGLTDDFRALWEEHADCWGRGCHGGKTDDEGFPIPTVIPAIVTEDHLSQFTSEEELFEFLKTTHPPQHPGYLETEEYHDIAAILFNMNNRAPDETVVEPSASPMASTSTSTPVPTSTVTPVAAQSNLATPTKTSLIFASIGAVILLIIIFGVQKARNAKQ